MLLSREWLSEFTDITATSKEYADAMTMSGSKVEATYEPADEIKNVLVGRVRTIERMPDSDFLYVAQVDVGRDEDVQIITGADNVSAGDLVPVALHKSRLPNGKKIEKGKIRGYKSEGMLCSLEELNLDLQDFPYSDKDGIFIMQEECSPGDDIRPIIGADTSIVEFEITSNRPDCLSVIGIARETAATYGTELKLHEPKVKWSTEDSNDINDLLSIEIQSPELCPRYSGAMVKNIKIEPSPKWMRQRLRAAGIRPISNIVDITNYVMLEYGQPMHAFDYSSLDGGKIIVRTAEEGESMNTLDGTLRKLSSDMLVIADSKKPVGIAGVMGGENSEITENTTYAVFESANFYNISIRKTAAEFGMRTDSSTRFEKGLDAENTLPAILRACELVEMLGAGEIVNGFIDIRATVPSPTTLKLEPEKINKRLGTNIEEAFMTQTLKRLGFGVDNGVVTVPTWRADVEHYTDLSEEIARFYGYDVIEPTLPKASVAGGFTTKQAKEHEVGRLCRAMGYSEILTYSLVGQIDYDKINLPSNSALRKSIRILNPLGEDTSLMRTTTLPSMLGALAKNKVWRNNDVRLYEIAKIYCDIGETLPDERPIITLGVYGDSDFFEIKGVCEKLLDEMRIKDVRFEAKTDNPSYHPGRTAAVYSGQTKLGIVGQVHPLVAKNYDLDDIYAAELDFLKMLDCMNKKEIKYSQLPRFPSIVRDVAVVCDDAVTVADLTSCIKKSGGKLLRDIKLFDIYSGDQVPDGKKSVAFSLTLRADDKTLTDEEANKIMEKVVKTLKADLSAVIRG